MHVRWGNKWGTQYYGGEGSAGLVPSVLDVALGGRPYRIDWSAEGDALRHLSVPLIRTQADQSDAPGEQSINPEGLWRRVGESWHLGAGQEYYDRSESQRDRFHTSKGIDPWTRFELSLLKETSLWQSDASSTQLLTTAGDYLYWYAGTTLRFATTFEGTFTTVTGTSATAVGSIASDGFHVWSSHGADGVYRTTRGAASATKIINGTVDHIGFVRGRLLASAGNVLYDVTAEAYTAAPPVALPTALHTHNNTDLEWVAFAEGSNFIYAASTSGDKSLIHAIQIQDDATALGAPTTAAQLPHGETIVSMRGYLGAFLFVGTTRGIRMAIPETTGTLTLGAFIPTPEPVLDFEGQRRFVWFGLSNYAPHSLGFSEGHTGPADEVATSSGLGRLDTAVFSDPQALVPAFASDLQHEGTTAAVQSVETFPGTDHRVFTIAGVGLVTESENCVPSGFFTTGRINYGITEPKTGLFFDAQHSVDVGSFQVAVSANEGAFASLGQRSAAKNPIQSFGLGEVRAGEFEFRFQINRDTTDTTLCPRLRTWLFRAQPAAAPARIIIATLLLASEMESLTDVPFAMDSYTSLEHIESLWASKAVTTWQQEKRLWSVIVEDFDLTTHSLMQSFTGHETFNGSVTVRLKVAET